MELFYVMMLLNVTLFILNGLMAKNWLSNYHVFIIYWYNDIYIVGHVCIKNKIVNVTSDDQGYKLIGCEGIYCETENAAKCEDECTANKGYLICKNKKWIYYPLKGIFLYYISI